MRRIIRTLLCAIAVFTFAATSYAQLRHDPDIDNDGVVNFVDLGLLRACFFMPPESPCDTRDLTGDGVINVQDLAAMRTAFFGSFPTPSEAASLYPKFVRTPFADGVRAPNFTDLNRDGLPDVVGASLIEQKLVWALGNGDGSFGSIISISHPNPWVLRVGHVNADDDPDVVIVDNVANRLEVFLGDGAGGFVAGSASLSAAAMITGATLSDLNADGLDDVVLTLAEPSAIATYIVQPDGSFVLQQNIPLAIPVAQPVVSDLDLDGALDLLVLVREADDERIEFLPGTVNDEFGSSQRLALNFDVVVSGFSVNYVNADALPDLTFWGNNDAFDSMFYLARTELNLGAGNFLFTAASTIDGGRPVHYGDIDDDGDADALTGGMRARYQTSDGVFGPLEEYRFGQGNIARVSDFNADGVPDVGAYELVLDQITVLLGRPGAPILISSQVRSRPTSVSDFGSPLSETTDAYLGDWNGDGSVDVLLQERPTQNFFGEYFETFDDFVRGEWAQTSALSTNDYWSDVWVADANGDGFRDVLYTDAFSPSIRGASGNSSGELPSFQNFSIFSQGGGFFVDQYIDVQFFDMNSDDSTDAIAIALTYTNDGTALILEELLRQPSGQYLTGRIASLPAQAQLLRATDFDDDGDTDFVVAHSSSVSVVTNADISTLVVQAMVDTGLPAVDFLETADFNGDEIADVVAVSETGMVATLLGTSTGNLAAPFAVTSDSGSISSMDIADLNADGRLDLVLAYQDRDAVAMLLGNGDGGFQAPVDLVVGGLPQRVYAVDLESDGLLEIVTFNRSRRDFSVLRRVP